MSDDNMHNDFSEFLEIFEQASKKMRAVECFAEIMKYVTRDDFDDTDEKALDGLVEILIRYSDREVMEHMVKGR